MGEYRRRQHVAHASLRRGRRPPRPRPGLYWYVIAEDELAVAEFRSAHPHLPIVLRVRRSNTRAIACQRRVGFTVTGSGSKSLPSGEVVPYYRMVLPS